MTSPRNKSNGGLDLVIVNPGSPSIVYQSLAGTQSAIEPPVWAGMIATFVRGKGFSVEIIDANALGLSPEETASKVSERDPALTAVVVYGQQPSASTQNMPASRAVCTAIKNHNPELKTAMIGGHVASLPDRTLMEEDVDFVSSGEGLYTIIDLLEAINADDDNYSKVRGLHYWKDGIIQRTAHPPLLKELDAEMPGIAWDLLPMEIYRAHNWHCFGQPSREPYAAIYTTLGCPYRCSFCCIQAPFKSGEKELGYQPAVNSYRLWTPENVIAQIDTLVNEYGVKNIKFSDEMFVLNRRHVDGLCDLLIERDYGVNIWAYARVDNAQPAMIEKLKKAGINWLAFGIEAANETVRNDVQKGFDQQDIYTALSAVNDAGINVIGNYIFGLPEDDLSSMQETLDMAVDLNCEFANFYCTMAYPGSALYDQAVAENWELPKDWSGYSQHSVNTQPLATKHLSSAQVLSYRDEAFKTYFNNPKYLAMVASKFGDKSLEMIKEMMSFDLRRDLVK